MTAATGAPAGGAKRKSPWRKTLGRYSKRNWKSDSNKGSRGDSIPVRRQPGAIGLPAVTLSPRSGCGEADFHRFFTFPGPPPVDGRSELGGRKQPNRQRRVDLAETAHRSAD